MSWVAVAVGAGVGVGKAELVDAPKAERQRKLAASTQRFSPWTHLQAQPVQEADPAGSALQYGATGASMGANMQNMQAQQDLMGKMGNYYDRGGMGSTANMTADTASPNLGVDYKSQFQAPSMADYSSAGSSPSAMEATSAQNLPSSSWSGMQASSDDPYSLPLGDPRRVGMGYTGIHKEYWPRGSA